MATGRRRRQAGPGPSPCGRARFQAAQPLFFRGVGDVGEFALRALHVERPKVGQSGRQGKRVGVVLGLSGLHLSAFEIGKVSTTDNPGVRGQQCKGAAVKLHDRLRQAQAEARAGLRSALLEPDETLGGSLAIAVVGDARTVIANGQPRLAIDLFQGNLDLRGP